MTRGFSSLRKLGMESNLLEETSESASLWQRWRYLAIAALSVTALIAHYALSWLAAPDSFWGGVWQIRAPLLVALALGGVPVVWELLQKLFRGEFGSDLLAAVSITASVILGEYAAGVFVVLMVASGETIERLAVQSASSVLAALSRRMPTIAHRRKEGGLADIAVSEIVPGDELVVFPHEICPVDGEVLDGHGGMDESFLTGEPYQVAKTGGSQVISGAVNGEAALTIRASKRAVDSRYAQIIQVMRAGQKHAPHMQRLGDRLGALYTPFALLAATLAGLISGDPVRFLAVIVTATPCPLLIAIPVAIVGAVSLSARRGIVVKKPLVLEQVDSCTVLIFDKTGTLTYGKPSLHEELLAPGFQADEVLQLAASLERYSKHPLAAAILARAENRGLSLLDVSQISEPPGQGLTGLANGRRVQITSRKKLAVTQPEMVSHMPPAASGLECVILIEDRYAAVYRLRDEPRPDGKPFIEHLRPNHRVSRVLLVSGDRQEEVEHVAREVGIQEIYGDQSPEDKLNLVRRETLASKTLFIGDGINDAPALAAATVGIAFGTSSDITSEAAGAIILDSSLQKVDEFLHISRRMRTIALQSALGGIALSMGGMALAGFGMLPPVAGAMLQEAIDVVAVLNALRAAFPPVNLADYPALPADLKRQSQANSRNALK